MTEVTTAPRVITSLADLSRRALNAEVVLADGEVVAVPLKLPSYFDMARMDMGVPDPVPPIMGVDKDGRPIFDEKNREYLDALATARIKRLYNRLIAMLALPIPGETLEEKIAAVDEALGYDVISQLVGFMNELGAKQKERLEARSFRPDGDGASSMAAEEETRLPKPSRVLGAG